MCGVMFEQLCEAYAAQRSLEEELVKLKQSDAAKMRQAALERHQLLQQIEVLSTTDVAQVLTCWLVYLFELLSFKIILFTL